MFQLISNEPMMNYISCYMAEYSELRLHNIVKIEWSNDTRQWFYAHETWEIYKYRTKLCNIDMSFAQMTMLFIANNFNFEIITKKAKKNMK